MKVTEFSIDRARLARNAYFVEDRACCLGQYAKACGHPGQITCDTEYHLLQEFLESFKNVKVFHTIVVYNADLLCGEDQEHKRGIYERRIVSAFARAGVTATFTGVYPA